MEFGFSTLHDQLEQSPLKTDAKLKGFVGFVKDQLDTASLKTYSKFKIIFGFLKNCKANSVMMDAVSEKFKESNDTRYAAVYLIFLLLLTD